MIKICFQTNPLRITAEHNHPYTTGSTYTYNIQIRLNYITLCFFITDSTDNNLRSFCLFVINSYVAYSVLLVIVKFRWSLQCRCHSNIIYRKYIFDMHHYL